MTHCEICGKPPTPYPTWIVGKGHAYHLGCLADDYELLRKEHQQLAGDANHAGTWGPWADGWKGSWSQKHWGEEN